MCSETIIFHCTSPIVIDHSGAVLFRTDTIHPMIFIGKTSARPTKHRHFQVFQCLKHIITIALGIGNFRILTYPQASIDTGSQMLCKLPVNMFTDDFFPLLGMYIDSRFLLGNTGIAANNAKPISAFFMIKNKIINYTIFAFSFFVWSNLHILHQPDSGQNCIFRGTKSSKVEKKRIFAYICIQKSPID